MYTGGMIIECLSCHYLQIWMEYPEGAFKNLQKFYQKMDTNCTNCKKETKHSIKMIKLKDLNRMKELHPGKKMIYTMKTLEEELKGKDI